MGTAIIIGLLKVEEGNKTIAGWLRARELGGGFCLALAVQAR